MPHKQRSPNPDASASFVNIASALGAATTQRVAASALTDAVPLADVQPSPFLTLDDPASIALSESALAAMRLRMAGLSYRQIADRLGIQASDAARLIRAYLDHVDAELAETATQLRRLELERLDALFAAVWQPALDGDLQAIDRALAIMKRRDELAGIALIRDNLGERIRVEFAWTTPAPVEAHNIDVPAATIDADARLLPDADAAALTAAADDWADEDDDDGDDGGGA